MHQTRDAAAVGSCCPHSGQTSHCSPLLPSCLAPSVFGRLAELGLLAGKVPSRRQSCASGCCSNFLSIAACAQNLTVEAGLAGGAALKKSGPVKTFVEKGFVFLELLSLISWMGCF